MKLENAAATRLIIWRTSSKLRIIWDAVKNCFKTKIWHIDTDASINVNRSQTIF